MGTPDFASNILKKLIDEGQDIIGVVTQPDKERGRGKNVSFSPVKEVAKEYNIPVYQPMKIREDSNIALIKELNPDIIIVAAFGQILPKELLNIPKYGCINVHASLLPKYRGSAPIQYSIINGDKETGITIMYMDEGIDTGKIISMESIPIDKDETGGSLFDKMAVLGADLLVRTLKDIAIGNINPISQNDSEATYVKIIKKEDGNIDFNEPAKQIERLIRGLNPWPSAYTYLDNRLLKIWISEVVELDKEYDVESGTIVEILKDKFIVKTGKDYLAVKEIQIEGKKRMSASAFLLGYKLETGLVLGKKK